MLNRYSYVRNNPLNATDPSGYFLTMIVGAVMMYFGVSAAVTAIVIGMLTFVQALAAGASLGNAVKAGVIAGVSTYAFAKIGQYFRAQGNANSLVPDGDLNLTSFGGNELTGGQVAQQVALHGITGGVTAELQGGKFGHGFFSAGFTKGVMGAAGFNSADPSATDIAGQTALAATVGGTVSEVTGGKFANGAQTAAIQYLFAQAANKNNVSGKNNKLNTAEAENIQKGSGWFRKKGHPYEAGRSGTFIEEGKGIGKFIDDYVPAGHTFATNHDNFVGAAERLGVPDIISNVPSMLPIYLYSVGQELINTPRYIYNAITGSRTNAPLLHRHTGE
jgi:hypothetical protein